MSLAAHSGEHYNARGLTPEVIADSFVASSQFWQVSSHGNSVLVGPRGSGKTTLLRMLDPRALGRWLENPKHQTPKGWSPPAYLGVFVPIDTAWVSSLTNATDGEQDGRDQLYLAVYSLASARCLAEVMRWRIVCGKSDVRPKFSVDGAIELELSRHLGEIFLLERGIRSLLELRIELSKRIAALPGDWESAKDSEQSSLVAGLQNPLALVASACDVFNALADEPDRKWSLLCDELEIAPLSVRRVLFTGLRAAPSPLLLKMALTPKEQLGAGSHSDPPLPANDYEVVPLSYPTREEGAPERAREEFCIAMWRSLVNERGEDLAQKLENPFRAFEEARRGLKKGATQRSGGELEAKFGVLFRSLAAKDVSFAHYLAKKDIDVSDLDNNPPAKRDAVIRKVRPIVEARDHNLRLGGDGRLTRISRRSTNLYCGAKRVFAVSEGHPRWLKYTLSAMLMRASSSAPYIRLTDQGRELRHAVQRIDARLRALPVDVESPYEFVQTVGAYFAGQILGADFRADPALSFIVDAAVSRDMQAAVAQALYIGALVPLQADVFHLFTKGLEGRRFRLSNWLAPAFALPLMTGKVINLSTILEGRDEAPVAIRGNVQFSLELGDDIAH